MSHNPDETKDVKSEESSKEDESARSSKMSNQEQSSVTVASQEEVKPRLSNQNDVELKETDQQKVDSAESSQEKIDTTESNHEKIGPIKSSEKQVKLKESSQPKVHATESSQQKIDTTESNHQKIKPTKSSDKQVKLKESSQDKVGATESSQIEIDEVHKTQGHQFKPAQKVKVSESVRQIVIWTMTGFFDFNPKYFTQMRGLTNLMHIVLSLTDIILLSLHCQLKPYPHSPSEGFYCKPPETFLFIISCCSFFTAALYLFCCVLSKTTDILLFQSSFEISYFVLYFIMLLTASLTLIVSEIKWEYERGLYENDYESSQIAAIIGLINSIMYGISAIWFFMSHRMFQNEMELSQQL